MIESNQTKQSENEGNIKDNPLLMPYDTQFNIPPFERIKPEHFLPAFRETIKKSEEEVDKIANNSAPADFANTIEALERAGDSLDEVAHVFFNLNSADTNPEIQAIAMEAAPLLSQHGDNIRLNARLFKRVESVYKQMDKLDLTQEQRQLLKETYKSFVRGGAALDDAGKERLRNINQKLSVLTLKFGENLLAETNAYQLVIEKDEDLAGLPQSIVESAAKDGKWIFTLHNPSVMPFLQYAENRELREKIFRAYMKRGDNDNEHDNKQVIKDIINLKLERANLVGYKTHADYVLEESMAKTPANVMDLLMKLWPPALNVARKEAAELQEMIDKEGGNFRLEPWDWRYYAEKVRNLKYDLDEEQLRPFLSLDNVREGIFALTNRLYGISYVERKDIPKYDDEVVTYEVLDADGSHLGVLLMDFHPRPGKRGGAWMTHFRDQHKMDGENIAPVISIVCNFSRPAGDLPSLLTWDEAETFFHEFGHALHGLFSDCNYKSISGTSVPRDFVEMPSQIMENWVEEPEVLSLFAKHFQSGVTMPGELMKKIKSSRLFNQGFATTEYLAAALLDMAYYTMASEFTGDVNQFEKEQLDKIGLIPEIISRYRSTYFNHIFGGGYSAGYYSYIWAAVLDTDAYELFKKNGLFDRATAESFRKNILERGKTDEPMNLYKRFRGAEPSIEPLLKKRGLA